MAPVTPPRPANPFEPGDLGQSVTEVGSLHSAPGWALAPLRAAGWGRLRTDPWVRLGILPISSLRDILHSASEAMNRDSSAPDQNAKAGSGSNKSTIIPLRCSFPCRSGVVLGPRCRAPPQEHSAARLCATAGSDP